MRKIQTLNEHWKFVKYAADAADAISVSGEDVNLPHTWNAIDGQDGGNDYYRGKCYYVKELKRPETSDGEEVYLEFRGVSSSAEVFVNGRLVCRHDGGYSTFRVNITPELKEENTIIVSADNSPNDTVYPQRADFTFYGGIYRDVCLITVPSSHFDLDWHGAPGIKVTPKIEDDHATVLVETYISGTADTVRITIDGAETRECPIQDQKGILYMDIPGVRLWNGRKDPYLYTATAQLLVNGTVTDEISTRFGCRTFSFDPEKGFFLNGQSYPLRGVSRHQDRRSTGNALTPEMHREDMELIAEMGANTIRLAHYQHDQYFYDLCDECGMIVWAEIPYITEHMPNARANTISQMTELIAQNYNHPSIICWGLSNEITVSGKSDDLVENHRILNDLAHRMDTTRPTAMAHAFLLDMDDDLVTLPDICSYNLYYGWYLGSLSDNDDWFDEYHKKHPQQIIGLSEYGADACPKFQTEQPEQGDYTEAYQCIYHEHLLNMFEERPYIWATHCWNMFDFAADGRDEGGEHGINQKGLVTFDRRHKKDAFYLYKAYLSDEPFVHICGRNYVNRCWENTQIKVYSNLPEVSLYDNGMLLETKKGNRIFEFTLSLSGNHEITARSGEHSDRITICKVTAPDESYILEGRAVKNWFDEPGMEIREGYYSIKDSMGDIKKSPAGAALLQRMMEAATASRGDVAKNVQPNAQMQKMMDRLSVEALIKQAGGAITTEMAVQLNQALSQIKKPD